LRNPDSEETNSESVLKKYGVDNLWKYDLPKGWRLLYFIEARRNHRHLYNSGVASPQRIREKIRILNFHSVNPKLSCIDKRNEIHPKHAESPIKNLDDMKRVTIPVSLPVEDKKARRRVPSST